MQADKTREVSVPGPYDHPHLYPCRTTINTQYTEETARACKEIVALQTRMLTALDPKARVDELDEAAGASTGESSGGASGRQCSQCRDGATA